MTYATSDDLIARFGEREIVQSSNDGPGATTINADVVNQALASTDAKIDGYLIDRYALPLAQIPAMLVDIECDLVRYWLATRNRTNNPTAVIKDRYDDAMRMLRDIAAGKFNLGPTGAGVELPSTGLTKFAPPDRIFDRRELHDFTPLNGRRPRRRDIY